MTIRRRTISIGAAMALSAVGLAAVGLAGCATSNQSPSQSPSQSPTQSLSPTAAKPAALSGTITVFAASSLKETFTKLGAAFEAANPGTKILFSFAASSGLATQITSGAPADVFAAASTTTMTTVVSAGLASSPVTFAKNTMEIAVPPTNPAGIAALADLSQSGVKVALCQVAVPCGSTAAKVFKAAKLTVSAVTLEPDVKSVLGKVELGEVDAGVVYVTDVLAAGSKVLGITIPSSVNATTAYPIAALSGSTNLALAQAFLAYVTSADGQAVLTAAGFAGP